MKFHLLTFGCQMNKADSETIAGLLAQEGLTSINSLSQADLIVFNTCCVRQHAENRLYGNLNALVQLKRKKPDLIVAVGGCVAQKEQQRLLERFPAVDIVFGTQNFDRLPAFIKNYLGNSAPICDTNGQKGRLDCLPLLRQDKHRAWIPIIRGCNNFCTYCIVPYVRGREISRPMKDIVREVEDLAKEDVKEIVLLGQNVNSYGKDFGEKDLFASLLKALDQIDSLKRIRFITSHPKDLSRETIEAVATSNKVCEHFHLPLQAGSNKILKAMKRDYTREEYLKMITAIREQIPSCSITTDLIVGFPQEEEQDFEQTLGMVKRIQFDQAFTFIYSLREGTVAARMEDNMPRSIKQERFDRLVELQDRISSEINQTLIDKTVEVLVKGTSKKDKNMLSGRTRTNKTVNFPGNADLIGTFAQVRIEEASTYSLKGKQCGETVGKPANNLVRH